MFKLFKSTSNTKLVLALGNPGDKYAQTRHNLGFIILDIIAKDNKLNWTKKAKLDAHIAEIDSDGQKIVLIKPSCFYNQIGLVAQKFIRFYKVKPSEGLLVIYDDLNLDFGDIRVRESGSDGGNNGIKSINSHIGQTYNRIKVGTRDQSYAKTSDTKFVLSKFKKQEIDRIESKVYPVVKDLIGDFTNNRLESSSYKAIKKDG